MDVMCHTRNVPDLANWNSYDWNLIRWFDDIRLRCNQLDTLNRLWIAMHHRFVSLLCHNYTLACQPHCSMEWNGMECSMFDVSIGFIIEKHQSTIYIAFSWHCICIQFVQWLWIADPSASILRLCYHFDCLINAGTFVISVRYTHPDSWMSFEWLLDSSSLDFSICIWTSVFW